MRSLTRIVLFCCVLPLALLSQAQTVCIDPGHPSEVGNGTRGKKYTELQVAWTVAKKLEKKLVASGFKVVLTKSSAKEKVLNRRRAEIANEAKSTLMVRLHCDAQGGTGFAVYYPANEGKAQGASGPSLRVRRLSKVAAQSMLKAMPMSLKGNLKNRGLKTDRDTLIGAKQGALTGSIFSEVPVVLVEMVVLTNPKDEKFLAQGGFDKLAEAIASGTKLALIELASFRKMEGA